MIDERRMEPVPKLLDLIAEHLEGWLAGDELALETMGDAIQARGFTPEQMQAAILSLQSMAGTLPCAADVALRRADRVGDQEWGARDGEATH